MRDYIKNSIILLSILIMSLSLFTSFFIFKNIQITKEIEDVSSIFAFLTSIDLENNFTRDTAFLHFNKLNYNLSYVEFEKDNFSDKLYLELILLSGDNNNVVIKKNEFGIQSIYAVRILGDNMLIISKSLFRDTEIYASLVVIIIISSMILIVSNISSKSVTARILSPLNMLAYKFENIKYTELAIMPKIDTGFVELDGPLHDIKSVANKLVKLENVRTDFITNVTHELKSPLTSIKGFAELINSGLIDDRDRERDYLKRIYHESERLLDMINDILYLSEVESTRNIDFERVDLIILCKHILPLFEYKCGEKKINITLDGHGVITGNKTFLHNMIVNLIDNSIKYGKENGYVDISVEELDDTILFSISDNGVGIPKDDISRIFERFYRGDKARNRKAESTGLGLSIVKHTVIKHNATIEVNSEVGEGTTMKIYFPKKLENL